MGAVFRHVVVRIFLSFTGELIMNKAMIAVAAIAASGTAFAGGHTSDDSSLDLEIGGFVWADVGAGDRYVTSDDDQTGISKAALTVSTSVDNVTAGMTLGVDQEVNTDLNSNGADDNDFGVREAWIAFDFDIADITIGKQALGFGLKPAGWVGGRPINDGANFGQSCQDVCNGINSSGQVVTGIAADFALPANISLRTAIFDSVDSGANNSMTDNFLVQLRTDDFFGTGLYASVGYEEVAEAALDIEGTSVGVGYDFGIIDVSIEGQTADSDLGDVDTLIIAASANLNDNVSIYLDYADADADASLFDEGIVDVETMRVGVNFAYNSNVDFILEYADDDFAGSNFDTDSIDLRVALSF
jgi:hypothetical protein